MPVYKQTHPNADTLPLLQQPAAIAGDAITQWSCTCPVAEDVMQDSTQDLDGPHWAAQLSSAQPQSQNQTQQQQQYNQQLATSRGQTQQQRPRQHLSTCALHSSNSLALLKQQVAKQKRQLEIQQQLLKQQQQRRRDPFEPVRIPPSKTFDLYAGSQFRGIQQSGHHSYDVRVDIKYVDLNESFLCGYLHINGLTEEYPELTTYFEAEIIGPKYPFLTHKWDANEQIDGEHWTRFKPFECLANSVFDEMDNDEDEDNDNDRCCPHHRHYDRHKYDQRNESVVFMRWKEHFLVPDHNVRGISGASFAGFYYICYDKMTGKIDGYYYHQSSEKYQQLLLTHVEDRSSGSFEFR